MPRYHSPGFEPTEVVIIRETNPYYMSLSDQIVEFNLTIPVAILAIGPPIGLVIGKIYTIKDGAGNADGYNITFTPASGTGTIDGVSTKVINSEYGSFSFYFDGTNLQSVNNSGGSESQTGRIVTASGTITMTNFDEIININKTIPASSLVIGPPSPPPWKIYTIKDAAGNAGTYPITLIPFSGIIDGGPNYVIDNNFDSVDFYWDGTSVFTK